MAIDGPQVLGDYLLIEQIGEGGMAEVYRARPVLGANQEEVVVKRIKPELFSKPEFPIFREMFLNEAKLVRSLAHPNLARVHALQEAKDQRLGAKVPFIVGEYIIGSQLWQLMRIATIGFTGHGVPPAIAAYIVREMALGLGHAHAHKDPTSGRALPIIHRDISPENVMLSNDGKVKVIDFGVAKAIGGFGPQTQTGIIKGKLAYMAPEQVAQKVVPATDVFGAGIVLHELLTGRRLFAANNEYLVVNKVLKGEILSPCATTPGIPKELEEVVMTALSRDLTVRYVNGNAFAAALTDVMQRVPLLRGTGSQSLKRWMEQTLTEGARIANQWQAESSGDGFTSAELDDAVQPLGSEDEIELTGEDLVFNGISGQVDPAVRAAVTQGFRTLKPELLLAMQKRAESRHDQSAAMPGVAPIATAEGARTTPPPLPAVAAISASAPNGVGPPAVVAKHSSKAMPVIALHPPPSSGAAMATAEASPLAASMSTPRRSETEHLELALYETLEALRAHPPTLHWLAAVTGLFCVVLLLLLLLLFRC